MAADWSCPDGELVLTVEQAKDRPLWLAERRKGIGASDVAALMGESRYATEFDVWLDKTGRKPDGEPTIPMEMGIRFEAAIAEKFSDDMGLEVRRRGMLRSRANPLCLANADRLVEDGYGLEIKVVNGFMKLPTDLSVRGGIPDGWFWQCVQNMLVSGRQGWYLAVALGNRAFEIRTLDREDPQVQEAMDRILEVVPAWWERYIVGDEIPSMGDGELGPLDELVGEQWEAFIPEQLRDWRDQLRDLRDSKKELERDERELKDKIAAESGGAEWLMADGVPVLRFSSRAGRASFQKGQLFARNPVDGNRLRTDLLVIAKDGPPEETALTVESVLSMIDGYALSEADFTTRGAPSRALLIVGDADGKE